MVNDHIGNPLPYDIGYSFILAARDLLYASSHRQDSTHYGVCCTSCGALAGRRNSSMGPLCRIDPLNNRTMSRHPTIELCPAPYLKMKF